MAGDASAVAVSEAEAVDRFLNDPNEHSLDGLFLAVGPRLIRYFLHRRCSYDMAEELTVDVVHCAYRQVASIRDKTRFLPWLFAIARNLLYRELSHTERRVRTLGIKTAAGVADTAKTPGGQVQSESQFNYWMSFLDRGEREVLELRYLDDLEYDEIAAALGIPIGTVKWRIFNSKKKLATRIGHAKMRQP